MTSLKAHTGKLQEGRRQRTKLRVMPYLAAVLSVVVALILARTLAETLRITAPVSLLLCAIIFSAWYGGVKPGFLALAIADDHAIVRKGIR